jgi:hypothetical protein
MLPPRTVLLRIVFGSWVAKFRNRQARSTADRNIRSSHSPAHNHNTVRTARASVGWAAALRASGSRPFATRSLCGFESGYDAPSSCYRSLGIEVCARRAWAALQSI